MKPAPNVVNGGSVICFTPINERHRHTGHCKQIIESAVHSPLAGLAICQYDGEDAFYLFGCDADWHAVTDTWHPTLDEAKRQAEFEYEGVSATWQCPPRSMFRVEFRTVIDQPWTGLKPICLGNVPAQLSTPDGYVTVEENGRPKLRIDLYRSQADESYPFNEARAWGAYVVIGFGHKAFLIDTATSRASTIELTNNFGHFYPCDSCLLIASADRLICMDPCGSLKWTSDVLGIAGVVVENVRDGFIEGKGDWDPPTGWRPFRIELETGKRAQRNVAAP